MASITISTTTTTRRLALKYSSSSNLLRITIIKSQLRHSLSAFHHQNFSTTTPAQEKKYTQDHEWIDLFPGAKIGTVGISTYAAHALRDIVYVELPTLPVTGVVVAVNELLEKKPSVMGTKPEDAGEEGGWIAKIEVSEEAVAELERLMGEEEYRASVNE